MAAPCGRSTTHVEEGNRGVAGDAVDRRPLKRDALPCAPQLAGSLHSQLPALVCPGHRVLWARRPPHAMLVSF